MEKLVVAEEDGACLFGFESVLEMEAGRALVSVRNGEEEEEDGSRDC